MSTKAINAVVALGCVAVLLAGGAYFIRKSNEAWGWEFPVEGLVRRNDAKFTFEQVGKADRKMLFRLGFAKALHRLNAGPVRHLVIYLDCHYFFTTDGRVIVMTPGSDGKAPQLVETKLWRGAPHDFRDYRKELLPST
jgi:hypothetical protein